MIESEWFKEQHRKTKEAFSRVRKLSFPVLMVFIMQKSVKSLQLAQHTQPQLILLDVYMPGMNGFEVCQHLKLDKQLQAIPIIFFSTSHKSEDIAAAFANQGQDYILKPANEAEVITRIMAHLQRSTLHYPLINRLIAYETRQAFDHEITQTAEKVPRAVSVIEKLYLARDLLLENLESTPSLDEIAQQIGLNRNKLNDEFRVLFGDTVFAWLREQRLQKARELLCQPTLSIQEIAEQIGHPSQSQFSRIFKQRFGQSPRQYRLSPPSN